MICRNSLVAATVRTFVEGFIVQATAVAAPYLDDNFFLDYLTSGRRLRRSQPAQLDIFTRQKAVDKKDRADGYRQKRRKNVETFKLASGPVRNACVEGHDHEYSEDAYDDKEKSRDDCARVPQSAHNLKLNFRVVISFSRIMF